jgi:hypothetical protein
MFCACCRPLAQKELEDKLQAWITPETSGVWISTTILLDIVPGIISADLRYYAGQSSGRGLRLAGFDFHLHRRKVEYTYIFDREEAISTMPDIVAIATWKAFELIYIQKFAIDNAAFYVDAFRELRDDRRQVHSFASDIFGIERSRTALKARLDELRCALVLPGRY